ncbi:ATP-binding protein [Marinoscillum pacificum]|uniref:ATP-binding protein n=1 Tax=Marinoscillum pacificum TaxID=392723 RepID=UPI0021575512|nr:ATP-binding protein [Marinoscillum pacificum]
MRFIDIKIRNKLALVMMIFAMAIVFAITTLYYYQFQAALKERVFLQLSSVKQLKVSQIRQRLQGIEESFIERNDLKLREQYGEVLFHGHISKDTIIHGFPIRFKDSESVAIEDISTHDPYGRLTISLQIRESEGCDVAIVRPNLQSILIERTGLGETGESYLVGSDKRMRTSSRFFPNQNPQEILVNTRSVRDALEGETGKNIIDDYRGVKVFSVYELLVDSELSWVIISEIDEQEALFPLSSLRQNLIVVLIIILVAIFAVSYELSTQLVSPVLKAKQHLASMAKGVFNPVNKNNIGNDELGQMFQALNGLVKAMDQTVGFADRIGQGDFDAEYQLLSNEDKLGASLIEMKDRLRAYQVNEEKLKRANQKSLISGEEKERSRLSKELHDGLGPLLTLLRLKIESSTIDTNSKHELLNMLDGTINEMRRISNNLMPSVLMDFGAGEAIRNVIKQLKNEEIKVTYQYDRNESLEIPSQIEITLFRIAQEAINNVLKHSGAADLKVSLTEFDDRISLFIKDNGTGFDPEEVHNGNGIRNMRERVNIERGIFELTTSKQGTTIEVEIPINEQD